MKKKILIIALVLILLGGVFSLTIKPVRNKYIDLMIPQISKTENCYYTDEDIESAIELVKERYKEKDKRVILLRLYFDEEQSKKKLKTYHLAETNKKENLISLFCDFYVLEGFGGYSTGLYSGWSEILVREEGTMDWERVDGGYA